MEPKNPVALSRVYLRKEGPAPDERPYVSRLMGKIEQEFEDRKLAVYARRSGGDRVRIWPEDYEIDWHGKSTDVRDQYCSVCAFRRGLADWTGAASRSAMADAPEDLAIERRDWERIEKSHRLH